MSTILDAFGKLPTDVVSIAAQLIGTFVKLVQAGDDEQAQEEALMEAQEALKAEMDRRKFGPGGTLPPP